MLTFNLLPWRIWRERQRKKKFLVQCTCILITLILLTSGFYILLKFNINYQQNQNSYLQQKITFYKHTLEKLARIKVKRNYLIEFLKALVELQRKENRTIRIFNFLNQKLPPNTYYTTVNHDNNQLKLVGYTQNNIEVNKLLEKFNNSQWLGKIRMKINKNKTHNQYPYTFNFIINEN